MIYRNKNVLMKFKFQLIFQNAICIFSIVLKYQNPTRSNSGFKRSRLAKNKCSFVQSPNVSKTIEHVYQR